MKQGMRDEGDIRRKMSLNPNARTLGYMLKQLDVA